jgi:hypothetical protein
MLAIRNLIIGVWGLKMIRGTIILAIFLLLSAVSGFAQPGTEIYLFDLVTQNGKIVISNPVNITNRKGYDNQPFFHPEKPLLYFASADDDGKTDIVEYNIEKRETRKLTSTAEKEYSPTVTPDKKFISCIVQRDNGAQDLVKYPINGGEAVILIRDLMVGYHAWLDDNNILIFVLGDPNTLRLYTLRPKRDITLAQNIGRSLHRVPGTKSLSFVHKLSVDYWNIKRIKEQDGSIESITQTLPDKEDLTWTPDGKILMSDGDNILSFEPGKSSEWEVIEIHSPLEIKNMTRLAVNGQGNIIAVVVNE